MSNITYNGRLIDGTLGQGSIPPERVEKKWFVYASTQVYVGSVVEFNYNADPENAAFGYYYPGTAVVANSGTTQLVCNSIAGVILDLGETKGTASGWITVGRVVKGDVVTLAVAVAVDNKDYLDAAAAGYLSDGSTTLADATVAICLYDEDSANNPHGTSAVSAAIGLVEAIWIGGADVT